MSTDLGSLSDYLSQSGGADTASSIGSLGGLDPITALVASVPSLIQLFSNPGSFFTSSPIGQLISAFSGRPTQQATQDISSAAGNPDPVIALLGTGAGLLDEEGVPISSSGGQANNFGPFFQTASDIENLIRWGTTNPTPQQAALTATTLKNALTELGNPGQGTATLQGLEQAWQQGAQNLTPQALQQLWGQMSPQEQNIFQGWITQNNPTLAQQFNFQTGQANSPTPSSQSSPQPTSSPSPTSGLTPAQQKYQNELQNYQQQYANYSQDYSQGQNPQPGAPPTPPSNPTPEQYAAYEQDYANYVKDYNQYVNQNAALNSQPAQTGFPNYGGPQPGVYPSGGQQFNPQYGLNPETPTVYQAQPTPAQARQLMHLQAQPQHNPPNIPPIQRQPGCPPCPSGGGGGNTGGGGGNTGGGGGTGTGGNFLQTLESQYPQITQWLNQIQSQPGGTPQNIQNIVTQLSDNTTPTSPGSILSLLSSLGGGGGALLPGGGESPSGGSNPLGALGTLAGLFGLFRPAPWMNFTTQNRTPEYAAMPDIGGGGVTLI